MGLRRMSRRFRSRLNEVNPVVLRHRIDRLEERAVDAETEASTYRSETIKLRRQLEDRADFSRTLAQSQTMAGRAIELAHMFNIFHLALQNFIELDMVANKGGYTQIAMSYRNWYEGALRYMGPTLNGWATSYTESRTYQWPK